MLQSVAPNQVSFSAQAHRHFCCFVCCMLCWMLNVRWWFWLFTSHWIQQINNKNNNNYNNNKQTIVWKMFASKFKSTRASMFFFSFLFFLFTLWFVQCMRFLFYIIFLFFLHIILVLYVRNTSLILYCCLRDATLSLSLCITFIWRSVVGSVGCMVDGSVCIVRHPVNKYNVANIILVSKYS